MLRSSRKYLLTLVKNGHIFLVVFDSASHRTLLDYLVDLAEDPETPLAWQDVFRVIDLLGFAGHDLCGKETRLRS